MERHWTDQMFVDASHIYIKFLEAAIPRAAQEAENLHKLLAKHQIIRELISEFRLSRP